MRSHAKQLKIKILKSILFTYIILGSIIITIVLYTQNKGFQEKNKEYHKLIHSTINYVLIKNQHHYHYVLNRILNTTNLKEYIIKNDRKHLYNILKQRFDLLREENKYFTILHIIKPNGVSFLRVHAKDKYGDNILSVRPMIEEVIKTKKTISGYETGKYSTAYRIATPLFYNNKLIAIFEIGINPNYFIDQIDTILNEQGMLFIKQKNLKLFSYKNLFQLQDYILQTNISTDTLNLLKHVPKDFHIIEDNLLIDYNNRKYLIHSHILKKYTNKEYGQYIFFQDITNMLKNQQLAVYKILFLLLISMAIIYIIIRYYFIKFETKLQKLYDNYTQEISKLKLAIEQAPISIVITDIDGNLEYVNKYFTKVTGYSFEEAIGVNPRILKTGYTSEEEYKKLWDEISHDHLWQGTFKNKKKNGQEYWEEAIIVPIEDKHGKVVKYLGIKQEVTEAVHLRNELKHKDDLLIAQSKHAAMGEMISMIAHQWRQPLSIISMSANNILADIELDIINNNSLENEMKEIINQTQELSQTIDDFRNFFKPIKSSEITSIEKVFNSTFKVIGKSLENNNVNVTTSYNSTKEIKTYSRELMQVFINILNNAKEALVDNNIKNRTINIEVNDQQDNGVIVSICDNAGGIDKDILPKIFNPYFSTKHKKNGTGLGLYISKTIVEKHLNGIIRAYNGENGACFIIELSNLKETNNE